MRAITVAGAILGAALALANGGCGGGSTATTPGTFSDVYVMLYPTSTNARCNFCHGLPANETTNGDLAMGTDKATAYAALVGKTSASTACGGKTLVVAGHPESSLFFEKLQENPPCGSRMPLGGNLLTADQLEVVRSWIAAGAKDD